MSSNGSPLHKVINTQQWDAQDFLGRLIVVVHAAFIEAGFVLASSKAQPLPWITRLVAAPAKSPSLRYTIPEQLLRRRSANGALAAVVRLHVHGELVMLHSYVPSNSDWDSDQYWQSMDARIMAPLLLTGSLDDAARALDSDAAGAKLWKEVLADGLCKSILSNLRLVPRREERRRATTFPKFMALPDDVMAAVLARLSCGKHLAVAESTCRKLRRLIADRDSELWKPLYVEEARHVIASFRGFMSEDKYIDKFKRL
ncbi:unnamed protein product [Urochloa humidicola]